MNDSDRSIAAELQLPRTVVQLFPHIGHEYVCTMWLGIRTMWRSLVRTKRVSYSNSHYHKNYGLAKKNKEKTLNLPVSNIYSRGNPEQIGLIYNYRCKNLLTTILIVSVFANGALLRVANGSEELALWYTKPASDWETEALPIGNGRMGAMLFGDTDVERMQFNVDSLWTGDENKRGSYQNFGDIYILFDDKSEPTSYVRKLDIQNAVHTVTYYKSGYEIEQKAFASYPAGIICWHVTGERPGGLSGRIVLVDSHKEETVFSSSGLQIEGNLDNDLRYFGRACVSHKGGFLHKKKEAVAEPHALSGDPIGQVNLLRFEGIEQLTIILGADTNYLADHRRGWRGQDPKARVLKQVETATNKGFSRLYSQHVADYRSLFDRFSLELPASGKDQTELPTDARIDQYFGRDPGLEELLLQHARYLLIASSRPGTLPANLRGIWTQSNSPPWGSDYHSNINTQMNYWLSEPANLAECHTSLLDYVKSQIPLKRRLTRQEFGEDMRGWTLRTENGVYGGESWKWNVPGSAWYAQHFWEHYAFGLDKDYLAETAYPILKEICQFWDDRLKEREDGTLVVPDGWSPEWGPVEDGVSYDQQIVYDLFTNYLDAAAVLDVDKPYQKKIADMRDRLLGPKVGRWGQLQEWETDRDDPNETHRHVSHLFAVHPGRQIHPTTTPKLAGAAAVSLEARRFGGTGWARAWKIVFWARLLNSEFAYRMVRNFIDGKIMPNGFDKCPPFCIDGNFGYAAGVLEMLLQSHTGTLILLPALPEEWAAEGEVKGLRARGGFTVDISWKAGKLISATVKSKTQRVCRVQYGGKTVQLETRPGREYALHERFQNEDE